MKNKSIGIMGGTFDPIHYGHLISAEFVYDALNLTKVVFIPTGYPPHKNNKRVSSKTHRLNLTQLAIKDNKHFDISSIELNREGNTYTFDTITQLKQEDKNAVFYFIMGADSLLDVPHWKSPEKLLSICKIVVVNRAEHSISQLKKQIEYLKRTYNATIELVKIPDIQISSSNIRKRVLLNQSIKYLVPERVEKYILENNIYEL